VAGYFVEYSAMTFALFYLGEYGNMILVSRLTRSCFSAAGWRRLGAAVYLVPAPLWFLLKTVVVMFCFRGCGDVSALPLRPADAARLEGVSAVFAVLAV